MQSIKSGAINSKQQQNDLFVQRIEGTSYLLNKTDTHLWKNYKIYDLL